jgi:hypothetical protein
MAHLGQAGHGVLGGGGLADAAFSVDCNFSHNRISILIFNPAETSDRHLGFPMQTGCQPFFTALEDDDYPVKSGEMKQQRLSPAGVVAFTDGEFPHLCRIEI